MKRLGLIFLAAGIFSLAAQEPAAPPARLDAASAFALRPPDESSPFFFDQQVAKLSTDPDFAKSASAQNVGVYPKGGRSPGSAVSQIRSFFTEMFSSIRIGPLHAPPTVAKLDVEPASFSLQDRREISVTYSIRNNTKKITRIEYPTSQRIEILTRTPQGTVIDRWSDDRTFENLEGIVVINPDERIEYQEKIPTREMKAGETYNVEAFATSEPNFSAQKPLTPQ